MKVLLVVLLLALAGGGAYFFYFKDHSMAWMQGPDRASGASASSAAGQKKDFKELCTRLQAAMDRIPIGLREARQLPAYALDTRSKLAPYLQLHVEYVTVTQACDLIIEADQAFAEHQEKCGLVPANAVVSPQARARMANGASPAMYQAQQTIWDHQRLQADSKVRQLLGTLENRRL